MNELVFKIIIVLISAIVWWVLVIATIFAIEVYQRAQRTGRIFQHYTKCVEFLRAEFERTMNIPDVWSTQIEERGKEYVIKVTLRSGIHEKRIRISFGKDDFSYFYLFDKDDMCNKMLEHGYEMLKEAASEEESK
jgi:hypothetical protein